ncbi:DUF4870 domain-containing protein [Dactylosporangium sp. NPDC051484]|uniref:DUF4870 domain-containing protein n=1 Tax=Dactylosporangium sp. NPDC051484 TaxID=3154942 RepID=UPI00344C726F
MSEPPRPPGEYGSPSDPNAGYPPQPPVSGGGYAPPPSSGGGAYAPPPTSGGGYQQPGYQQPGYEQPGYQQPGYQQQGYQQPGYQQQGAYGAPGGAPAGYANSDEKTWALIAHFGGILFGFVAPLVALLAKGNESPTIKAHANEALNFQITWGIAMIVSVILSVCSFGILIFLPFIVWIVVLVFSILGGMKANNGELYRYPMTFRFIK